MPQQLCLVDRQNVTDYSAVTPKSKPEKKMAPNGFFSP